MAIRCVARGSPSLTIREINANQTSVRWCLAPVRKDKRYVLVRLRGKGGLCPVLVGCGLTAIGEDSIRFPPQKIKNGTTL